MIVDTLIPISQKVSLCCLSNRLVFVAPFRPFYGRSPSASSVHLRFTMCVRSFPNVVFETVPVLVRLTMALSLPGTQVKDRTDKALCVAVRFSPKSLGIRGERRPTIYYYI